MTLNLFTGSKCRSVPAADPGVAAPCCIAFSTTDGTNPRSCIRSNACPENSRPPTVPGAFLGIGAFGFGKLACCPRRPTVVAAEAASSICLTPALAARRDPDVSLVVALRFSDALRGLAVRNKPSELCSADSKPQTRVFVCTGSSADAVPATDSSVASAQTKTLSHLSEARRRKTWSKAGTRPSLAAFFQGN